MPRKQNPTLNESELRLMEVVWNLGEAAVSDVVAALPDDYQPAYNTVLTTLRILEQKGYLHHIKEGRAHIYQPNVSRAQAQKQVVRHMVQSFFDDSPELLLLSVLENEEVSPADLERLKRMTEDKK